MGKADILFEYLNKRNVKDKQLEKWIINSQNEKIIFKPFSVDNEEYILQYFLDETDRIGYGLIRTNEILKLGSTDYVAIALVEGDDVICLNTKDGTICLWLIQTNEGELHFVAGSFEKFLELSIKE